MRFRSGATGIASALLSVTLVSCGGGGGSSDAPPPAAPGASGRVSGGAMKGPLRGADITVCDINDCEAPADETTTDGFGNFSINVPAHGRYTVLACNGSFVDESDPAPVKRSIDLTGDCLGQVLLPAGASTVALNVVTLSAQRASDRLTLEKQAVCPSVRGEDVFDAVAAQTSSAFGLNVFGVLPQGNPTNPQGSNQQKQYAMVMGGIAQAINEASGRSGRTAMDIDMIQAVIADLSDGVLDAGEDGDPLGLPSNPLPLNAQIQRFRNNNAGAYASVPNLVVDEATWSADLNLGPQGQDLNLAVPEPGGSAGVALSNGVDGILDTACDPESDTVTTSLSFPDPPNHGSVLVSAGVMTYTHDGGASTSDSFTYRLTDGQGKQGPPATVFVTITPLPPDADGDGLSDAQEALLGTNPNDSDSDGDGSTDFDEVNVDGNPADYNAGGGDTDPNNNSDFPGAACVTAPPGLVAWYPGESDASDIQSGQDGALQNGAGTATGKVGNALSFDGVSAQVLVGASSALDVGQGQGMTIEGWFKPATLDGAEPLMEWNNGNFGVHLWEFTGNGNLYGNLVDTSGSVLHDLIAPGILVAGTFQHIALTYDKASGVGRLFHNGVQVAQENLGSFTPQTSYPLAFGRRASDSEAYAGLMDEVSIYNRALAPQEVSAIAAASGAGKCKPPSADSDGDGLPDAIEAAIGSNPNNSDSDGDGYGDYDEVARDGNASSFAAGTDTSPSDPDTDNDDINDFLEVNAGSDPNSAETSANRFYLAPSGTGSGTSWADAADTIGEANSWLNSRPSAGVFYLLLAEDPGFNYGAPLFVGDQLSPGVGVPPFSVVVAIGGLDPAAPASQQGLYQAQGSLIDGGADCSDGVPAGSGQLISVAQEQLSNLGLIGLKLVNGRVTGGNNGGGIQTVAAPGSCGSACPVLVLSDTKVGSSCSESFGGGIYLADNWRAELYSAEVSANSAMRGGGIYGSPNSSISISDSILDGNVADEQGGAVASTLGNSVDISNSSFRQNLVFSSSSTVCAGGALYQEGNTGDALQIRDSLFADNDAFCGTPISFAIPHGGGAVFARGQDVPAFTGFSVDVRGSRFLSNNCSGSSNNCNGGALNMSYVGAEIINNLFVGNVAVGRGGAVTTHDNGGFFDMRLNTIAYNQAFDSAPIGGIDSGGGYFGEHNAGTVSKNNIMFFNDDGTVSAVHANGEDCEQRLVEISSSNDTIGSQTCTSSPVSLLATDPLFTGGFFLDPASTSVDSGSEADADSFFCGLVGCPPDHPFTTRPDFKRDGDPAIGASSSTIDRGFHYTAAAEAPATGASAAPGQNNNAIPNCSLSYGFTLNSAGPDLIEGHKVGVCLVSAGDAASFGLSGQGTLDPVNNDGSVPAGCSERAVLATDSGINGVYSISVSTEGVGGGPFNIGLRLFVDDSLSFTHTISNAFFDPGCGLF